MAFFSRLLIYSSRRNRLIGDLFYFFDQRPCLCNCHRVWLLPANRASLHDPAWNQTGFLLSLSMLVVSFGLPKVDLTVSACLSLVSVWCQRPVPAWALREWFSLCWLEPSVWFQPGLLTRMLQNLLPPQSTRHVQCPQKQWPSLDLTFSHTRVITCLSSFSTEAKE